MLICINSLLLWHKITSLSLFLFLFPFPTPSPPSRPEEQCLVRSGLVKLLDRLCSLVDSQKPLEVGGEEDDALHRVTSLAWAAFQVLADRCVSWETQDSAVVSSGLAQQV